MLFNNINSAAVIGLESTPVNVEVNIDNRGFPRFDIVGLAAKEINESKERIKSAIRNSGLKFPNKKILVNLAPSDLSKSGSLYDVPIAVGVLASSEYFKTDLSEFLFAGGLSLDGSISKVSGVTLIAIEAKMKNKILVIPQDNLVEVSFIKGLKILAFQNLKELSISLQNKSYTLAKNLEPEILQRKSDPNNLIENIKGHEIAKRALVIAAAGRHNICFIGSPGSGKTMLIRSLESILPSLTHKDFMEVMKIRSVTGQKISLIPPFRAPNYPVTKTELFGSTYNFKLGEVTLAHKGVLFLDEFTEYENTLINALRQPTEDKKIKIQNKKFNTTLPCDFMLAISANPCACGNYGDPDKKCICTDSQIKKYALKLKNPLMDRIDIFVNVFSVSSQDLLEENNSVYDSENLNKFLSDLRSLQMLRSENLGIEFKSNADISIDQIKLVCTMDKEAVETLNSLNKKYSSRSIHKILKVSRTIADIENSADIKNVHLLEAIQYKSYLA